MPYSTLEDLLKEYGPDELARLTDPYAILIDELKVNHAVEMADAVINAYLYGRYDVPFESPDPVIRKIAIDLAAANLYEYAYSAAGMPNTAVWRRLNALKMLRQLQEGSIIIPGAKSGDNAPPALLSNKSESDKYFDNNLLDNFTGE